MGSDMTARIVVAVDRELRDAAVAQAKRLDVTMSQVVRHALREFVASGATPIERVLAMATVEAGESSALDRALARRDD